MVVTIMYRSVLVDRDMCVLSRDRAFHEANVRKLIL